MKRAWDGYSAYLFDIDGTLLHCHDAVHYFAFCDVLSKTAGRPLRLDGVITHGNTDVGIMRDALLLAELAETSWRPQLHRMREDLCRFVEQRSDELRVQPLPGAKAVLKYLRARGAKVGVATGNLERIGWSKLRAAGLAGDLDFGGFSDAHEYRADVFRGALERATTEAHCDVTSICVLGDTPSDVEAAHANGLEVIAVASGVYSREELIKAMPDMLVNGLDELLVAARLAEEPPSSRCGR